MTVAQLMAALDEFADSGAEVLVPYDGGCGIVEVQAVWRSQNGEIMLSSHDGVIYDDLNRPIGAPTRKQSPYWSPKDGLQK